MIPLYVPRKTSHKLYSEVGFSMYTKTGKGVYNDDGKRVHIFQQIDKLYATRFAFINANAHEKPIHYYHLSLTLRIKFAFFAYDL